MTGYAPDEEEQSSRVGSSLPQPRESSTPRQRCPAQPERSLAPVPLDERRRWALSLLRHPEPDSPGIARHPSLRGRGCSELVRVLLWEGDPDATWQAASEGGCTRDLWSAPPQRQTQPDEADGRAQHCARGLTPAPVVVGGVDVHAPKPVADAAP
jgi:hypothetical protein